MPFSEKDQHQIRSQGTTIELINEQIKHFVDGFPYVSITKAATAGDGIVQISDYQLDELVERFEEQTQSLSLLKFVPASGAATRMFKSLFAALEGTEDRSVEEFFRRLPDFAFFEPLQAIVSSRGQSLTNHQAVISSLLTNEGLGYGTLPKGLLLFHRYPEGARTPVEEHLVEGAEYANANGLVRIHFTVSPEHRSRFKELIDRVKPIHEERLGVQYEVTFSEQKKSTDTISVNLDNTLFRNVDGSLVFRPAGHGALIENLNDIDADVVFIKNIDNVVPDNLKELTFIYKKAIGAILLDTQRQLFRFQELLEGNVVSDGYLAEAEEFLYTTLYTLPPDGFERLSKDERLAYCRSKLDRPVRVCGMVKNVGEPGGGPFWTQNRDGSVSLQIVESAQIELANPAQKHIFETATHFNPVDLVCTLKNRHGHKYDLRAFRDPQTGFITSKSKDGNVLKAQELPGLWNGAMANWNTIFVEVPLITFNPVKTVNDLLRKEHQPTARNVKIP